MFWLSAAMIGSSEGRAAGPVKVDSRRRRRRWSAFAGLAAPSPHSAALHDLFTSPVLALERAEKISRGVRKTTCKMVGRPDTLAATARMFAVCHKPTRAAQQVKPFH